MPKKKKNNQVDVVPNGDGWSVKTGGSKKSYRRTTTKKDAIEIGRDVAKNKKGELAIHNKDGKIGKKHSYGNDPHPPKG